VNLSPPCTQGPTEQDAHARVKRATFEADASWKLQDAEDLDSQGVSIEGGEQILDELVSEEDTDAAAPGKSIYDDWDDDAIAL